MPEEQSSQSVNDNSVGPITSHQAKNVRFTKKKNGYAYDQVETFLDQVIATLEFVESQMLEDHTLLEEAKAEIRSQEETIANLKATIEVFRARGDVLTNSDGSFATSSSTASEISRLEKEKSELEQRLVAAKEDADAGWAAEAELRQYVEQTLKPWLEKNNPGN
jgi:DivIVA domain-containing protein